MQIEIRLEFTPNPNALKYVIDEHIFLERGTANFSSKQQAEKVSLLGTKILSIPGVDACLIGRNYVTVTKKEEGDWEYLDDHSRAAIKEHIESGLPAVEPILLSSLKSAEASSGHSSEMEQKIKEILDKEIRPAVAMDGGDIIFERFEDGIVYLYMQGACSGCPSSTATLKMGIEARLQKAIPEIKEVIAL